MVRRRQTGLSTRQISARIIRWGHHAPVSYREGWPAVGTNEWPDGRPRGDAVRGMTPNPGVVGSLLVTALWLAAAGLLVAWWSDGAIGWATLWEALAAASLALWALSA